MSLAWWMFVDTPKTNASMCCENDGKGYHTYCPNDREYCVIILGKIVKKA
jgi:hypothetical protein